MRSRALHGCWMVGLIGAAILPGSAWAQPPSGREHLLRLVPPDTGVCLVVSDLREHWKSTLQARWFKAFTDSALGAALARAPELRHLIRIEQDLKKHLDVDVVQLRDEILGDALIFAYTPGPAQRPDDEEGLLLLWARQPSLLSKLVDRLNKAQKASGEVTDLSAVAYQGKTYMRRAERHKTHYYFLHGSLLAVSTREKRVREVIDAHAKEAASDQPLQRHLRRAGADRALAALWLNPRTFDSELRAKSQGADPQAQVIKGFLKYWQAIDGIVLSANLGAEPEVRLSVQARAADIPASLQALFSKDYQASELWERFPSKSILRIAGKIDLPAVVDIVRELTPNPAREAIGTMLRKTLAATLGLDPVKDVLPRLGPDWGLCITDAEEPGSFPHVIAVVAVQPGPKPVSAGAAIYKAAQFFTHWAVLQYNLAHAEAVHVKTVQQDKSEVLILESQIFPSGLRPAMAIKDGYFLIASSPEAIARFQKGQKAPATAGELPLLHLSMSELSAWLQGRKDKVIAFLQEKNQLTPAAASQWLDGLLAGLSLFDNLSLTQRSDAGQVSWVLRLREKK